MVVASLEKGRHSEGHKQWDTIRKIRSTFSNQVRAAAISNFSSLSLADNQGSSYQRLAPDPCGSLWFQRFMAGCKKRMGQDWRPNRAISVEIMEELLKSAEGRALAATEEETRHKWVMGGAYFCVCFVLSLRSTEGLLADLEGMIEHYNDERPHVIIPLLGRFKGEDHSSQHLMPCVSVTESGIQVKTWIRRLMAVHRAKGRVVGPMFINDRGVQSSTYEMNSLLIECLTDILEQSPTLFGSDVKTAEDLVDKYHVFRSFRRGSESRAVAMKRLRSVPISIPPIYNKILHRGLVIPLFVYCRFYVWPFVVWRSAMFESKEWLQQMESTLFPGIYRAMMYVFTGLTVILLGLNLVLFRRLVNHPHLQRVYRNHHDNDNDYNNINKKMVVQ
ncbi:hypothetical protein MHU86_229 [Fragilaria crotonensis]|nr:hypothetical protein MHU86_229 [Fragilaria crotonensis]